MASLNASTTPEKTILHAKSTAIVAALSALINRIKTAITKTTTQPDTLKPWDDLTAVISAEIVAGCPSSHRPSQTLSLLR